MKNLILAVTMILGCVSASAQAVSNELAVGFPENGVFAGSNVENVQVNNGNLHVEIPIWSYPGRGIDSGAYFVYDSKGYFFSDCPDGTCVGGLFTPEVGNTLKLTLVAKGTIDLATHRSQGQRQTFGCNGTSISMVNTYNWVIREANGTKHALIPNNLSDLQNQTCIPNTNILHTFDGSGIVMNRMSGHIFHKDGNQYGTEDSNGNYLTQVSAGDYTDTLGRTYHSDGSYTDANGASHALSITTESVAILTHLCGGLGTCGEYADTWTVPHVITLPNGLTYTIEYVQNDAGEIQSITFPTGATVSYTYANPDRAGPRVHTRTVTVNGTSSTWTYTYPPVDSSSPLSITVQNPDLTSVAYTCTELTSSLDFSEPPSVYSPPCYMTKVDTKATDGTVIQSVSTVYDTTSSILPKQVTTAYPASNQISQVTYAYDQTNVQAGSIDFYDVTGVFSWGNVVDKYEYDFGTGAPGPLLRHTHYDYLHVPSTDPNVSNPNWQQYQDLNIATHPVAELVYDGAGKILARTYSTYDGSSLATPPGTLSNHTASYDATFLYRGNLTHQSRWIDPNGSNVATNLSTTDYTYDILGNRLSEKDANGNITSYDYTDSFTGADCVPSTVATYAFVKTTTNALGQSTTSSRYNCTGQLAAVKDANDIAAGQSGTTYSYDSMNRLESTTYPDGGQITMSYSDSIPYSATTTTKMTSSTNMVRTSVFDGLGRVSQTKLVTDPQGADLVDTTYDLIGRVASVSNPHRSYSSPTDGITSYAYDALSRRLLQCNQDNGTTGACTPGTSYRQWVYTGTTTDIYDEHRNHSQQTTDGLGRLTVVKEPDSTNTPTFETDYTYDALSNLIRVNQKGKSGTDTARVRSFAYDGLSRLYCAENPENNAAAGGCPSSLSVIIPRGAPHFAHDANGNLISRTDGRGAVANYTYDALNRIKTKTYLQEPTGVAPTSNVNYTYDVAIGGWGWVPQTSPSWPSVSQTNLIGRLSEVSVGTSGANAWTVYGYDEMGRTVLKSECLPIDCGNNHHDMHYKFDLGGRMAFYDRGLDAVVNQRSPNSGYYFGGFTMQYDGAGNLSTVTGDTGGTNTATNIWSNTDYFPTGRPYTVLALGRYNLKYSMNSRNWVTGQVITNTATQSIWNSSTSYNNTGTVSASTDRYAGAWSYTYDTLNRIWKASGPGGSTTYSIDAFGNKYQQTTTAGVAPSPNYGVATTNGLSGNGLQYDLGNAGNVTNDGVGHTFQYDAEGRLYSVNGTTCFTYDGDGDRVAKTNCNVVNSGNGNTTGILSEYLYDINHRLMTEVNATTHLMNRANIYAGSLYLAEDAPDAYLTNTPTASLLRVTDAVGTLRGRWDLGSNWDGACTSFPYGDGMACTVAPLSTARFAGKDRDDTESGLDYFGARYYSSTMGRIHEPDWAAKPEAVPYADLANPQSLNLFGYVNDDPESRADADGHIGPSSNNEGGVQLFSLQEYLKEHPGLVRFFVDSAKGAKHKINKIGGHYTGRGEFTISDLEDDVALGSKLWKDANTALGVVVPILATDGLSLEIETAEAGALGAEEAGAAGAAENPLENLNRVGSALKKDPYHAFPSIVDNYAAQATKTSLRDGVDLYQVEGSLNGRSGRFDWIVDNGQVTHRMFVPGGAVNGIPITK